MSEVPRLLLFERVGVEQVYFTGQYEGHLYGSHNCNFVVDLLGIFDGFQHQPIPQNVIGN